MIIGSNGQDGRLMSELLQKKEFQVVGINRENCDIGKYADVLGKIAKHEPKYVFYFAAHHTSSTECQIVANNRNYFDVNTIGVLNFLDAIKSESPKTRFYFASSSLIFKSKDDELINEKSEIDLNDLYSISKYSSMRLCEHYRKKYNLQIVSGIMFNHESRYRQNKFVSRKIVDYVVGIKKGFGGSLSLGSLDTVVDWGAAEDYMEAIFELVEKGKTGEYIISSGSGHTLRQFCEVAFSYLDLDYTMYLSDKKENLVRINNTRVGDNSKLKNAIEWQPKISFEEMIHRMIDFQMKF